MQICSSILWPEQQIWDLSSLISLGRLMWMRKGSFFLHSVCFDFPKLLGCQISTFIPRVDLSHWPGFVLTYFFCVVLGQRASLWILNLLSSFLENQSRWVYFASLCAMRPLAEGICWFLWHCCLVAFVENSSCVDLCRFVHTMRVARLEHSVYPVMQLSLQ